MFNIIATTFRLTIVTSPFGGIASNPIKHLYKYFAAQTTLSATNLAFTK